MNETVVMPFPQPARQRADRAPVRYLILRAHPGRARASFYNSQELGLAGFLQRAGIDVGVAAAFSGRGLVTEPSCRIHQLNFRPRHPAAALIRNLRSIELGSYDIIQISDLCLPGNLQVLLRAPRSTHFIVYQGHYPEPLGMGRWVRVLQSRLAAAVLRRRPSYTALAKNVEARRFLERSGIGPAPVVGVGLNAEPLLATEPIPGEVTRFLERPTFTLLYVGNLDARRPLDWVLPHLYHPDLGATSLLVVGAGPALEPLRRRYADLVASRRVMFVDRLSQAQLGSVYRRVGALVLPTRYEIYGMVCLEGVLFGVPVIASGVAGPATAARRFPHAITLVEPGESRVGWRAALVKAQRETAQSWRCEPDTELVRALSWETPGRAFLTAIDQAMS